MPKFENEWAINGNWGGTWSSILPDKSPEQLQEAFDAVRRIMRQDTEPCPPEPTTQEQMALLQDRFAIAKLHIAAELARISPKTTFTADVAAKADDMDYPHIRAWFGFGHGIIEERGWGLNELPVDPRSVRRIVQRAHERLGELICNRR